MVLRRGYYPNFLKNTPIRLTKEELNDPMIVLKLFFNDFDLNDVRHGLEDLRAIASSAELPCMTDPFKRNSIEFIISEVIGLAEACFILNERARKNEVKEAD